MTCPHLDGNICGLASYLANQPIETTPENCHACGKCNPPQNINEVVLSLAGIEQTNEGVGSTLHKLITWFIPQPANCSCPNRVAIMNAWGKERCLEELPTILSWLRESALDNGYPYSEFVISAVVKNIIKKTP